jgi:hypothetical protein
MKKVGTVIAFMCIISCNNKKAEKNISTVDSNIITPADSNDAFLYLDDPRSDSFNIAVDSGSNERSADTSLRPLKH